MRKHPHGAVTALLDGLRANRFAKGGKYTWEFIQLHTLYWIDQQQIRWAAIDGYQPVTYQSVTDEAVGTDQGGESASKFQLPPQCSRHGEQEYPLPSNAKPPLA